MSDEAVGVEVGSERPKLDRSKLFRGRKRPKDEPETSDVVPKPSPVPVPAPVADTPTVVYIPARRRG